MEEFIIIVSLIFGILNLILFFKIWGMTNDVKRIANKVAPEEVIEKPKETVDVADDAQPVSWINDRRN